MPDEDPAVRAPGQRLVSIDLLRGLTIALMIVVNDPGDWAHVFPQLDHAAWNGFTLTDFVFPNFLFLVGFSIVLSLRSRAAQGQSKKTLARHMVRRAAALFAIKLFLSAFPHFHVAHLRLYGVLTRIALCYLAAGLLCLISQRARTLLVVIATLLLGYWALLRFVPIPGFGVPTHGFPILDPERNLAAWLDRAVNTFTQRWLHTGSLYNRTHDPEGLLSTLPALATTLIGCVAAVCMHVNQLGTPAFVKRKTPDAGSISTLRGIFLVGLLSPLVGWLWSFTFPINKNLWTSSYVLFAAGWSLLLLALAYWLFDLRRIQQSSAVARALIFPWLVFGANAIAAFVLSNFLVEVMLWIKVPPGPPQIGVAPTARITAWLWTYRHLFARTHSTEWTSLAFAVAFTALCFLPNWLLWRRRIFLKL